MRKRSLPAERFVNALVFLAGTAWLVGWGTRGDAAERTFLLAPGEVVSAVDSFNGRLLTSSAALPKRVKISKGATVFDRVKCPSLSTAPGRLVSRISVLDSAERAAAMADTRKPREALSAILNLLGADSWALPAVKFSSNVPGWTAAPLTEGPPLVVFQASGARAGDSLAFARLPGHFRFVLELSQTKAGAQGEFSLVMGVTSQSLGERRRRPKMVECFFLVSLVPADMEELGRRLAEAPLPARARTRLQELFDRTNERLAAGKVAGAKESLATFAGEVGSRMNTQMDPQTIRGLMEQALRVMEAL